MLLRILICFSILFSLKIFAQDQITAPHVQVRLISSHQQLAVGEKSWWGVQFKLDPHWHVYWKNPGDSGAAPKFNFEVENGNAGVVQWPNPVRIKLGDLVNFGYEKEVIYPFEVTAHKEGTFKLKANLEWLVCQEECVPGFADLELTIPVSQKSILNPKNSEQISQYLNQTPSKEFKGTVDGKFLKADAYELTVAAPDASDWDVFPIDGEKLAPQEPLKKIEANKITWTFKSQPMGELKHPQFVIRQAKEPFSSYEISVSPIQESSDSVLGLIFFAFLGGILLNLMPCVFPVLSIKIFSMVKEAHGDRAVLFKEGVFYTLGVLVTFVSLGVLFLVLRKSGEAVGWGFQLQSPVIIYLLILLFFVMALHFLGVYEFGTGIMNRAGSKQTGSFGTGVLSVFVAAPCTGPFMGAALGAAVALPSVSALAIFFFLGIGLALPILILSASPALTKILPKPGMWMEKLKQFFAFPLFATALWLFWVLIEQKGSAAVLPAGGGILLMSLALWTSFESWKKWMRIILILIALMYPIVNLKNASASNAEAKQSGPWRPYNKSEIETARATQSVFVDFTAAWCITCQWNKKSVLETEAAQSIFKMNNTLLIRADWTNYDKNITDALSTFGRASVPLYVFYPAGGGEPRILPQMLSMSMIEELYQK